MLPRIPRASHLHTVESVLNGFNLHMCALTAEGRARDGGDAAAAAAAFGGAGAPSAPPPSKRGRKDKADASEKPDEAADVKPEVKPDIKADVKPSIIKDEDSAADAAAAASAAACGAGGRDLTVAAVNAAMQAGWAGVKALRIASCPPLPLSGAFRVAYDAINGAWAWLMFAYCWRDAELSVG